MDIFLPIFGALGVAGVRYITVGGLATVMHGYARLTSDIDLIVQLDEPNCRQAIECLCSLGFRPRAPVDPLEFAVKETREEWIKDKGLTVFSMYRASGIPIEVDLFVREPLDFDTLWNNKVEKVISGITIHIVDKASLILLKEQSGRPKDLEDIAVLRSLDEE